MKKIKQLFRKGVALALAAVTTLSVLPAATVSAASQRATITFAYCYDGNGNTIRYQQTAYSTTLFYNLSSVIVLSYMIADSI